MWRFYKWEPVSTPDAENYLKGFTSSVLCSLIYMGLSYTYMEGSHVKLKHSSEVLFINHYDAERYILIPNLSYMRK